MKYLLLLLVCFNLHAEPIEFVNESGPGGSTDIATRYVMEKIEAESDLKFVMVYKPGANKSIAYNYVENTNKPTLILTTDSILEHEAYKSVDQIFYLGNFQVLMMVNSQSNLYTLNDLKSLSEKRPITFGHLGEISTNYKIIKPLCDFKVVNCLPVPYKSGPEGMVGVLNSTIDFYPLLSFGTKGYQQNKSFRSIHAIDNSSLWVKIFGKNLSAKDKETIQNVLKNHKEDFYNDLGLMRK